MGDVVESAIEMKIDSDGVVVSKGFPSFSEMGDWFFWVRARDIGFGDDADLERATDKDITVRMQLALNKLRDAEVPGVEWWMSDARKWS